MDDAPRTVRFVQVKRPLPRGAALAAADLRRPRRAAGTIRPRGASADVDAAVLKRHALRGETAEGASQRALIEGWPDGVDCLNVQPVIGRFVPAERRADGYPFVSQWR